MKWANCLVGGASPGHPCSVVHRHQTRSCRSVRCPARGWGQVHRPRHCAARPDVTDSRQNVFGGLASERVSADRPAAHLYAEKAIRRVPVAQPEPKFEDARLADLVLDATRSELTPTGPLNSLHASDAGRWVARADCTRGSGAESDSLAGQNCHDYGSAPFQSLAAPWVLPRLTA